MSWYMGIDWNTATVPMQQDRPPFSEVPEPIARIAWETYCRRFPGQEFDHFFHNRGGFSAMELICLLADAVQIARQEGSRGAETHAEIRTPAEQSEGGRGRTISQPDGSPSTQGSPRVDETALREWRCTVAGNDSCPSRPGAGSVYFVAGSHRSCGWADPREDKQ